jgi:hypothetical protein
MKLRCLLVTCLLANLAAAQSAGPAAADSLDLARLKNYTAHRVSSNNRYAFSNDDSKRLMPGQTIVLADLTGPGAITHIWATVADNEFGWPRLLRLRVYYDGCKTPSVDAPLGDFFGVGHGYERNLNSMMIRDGSFGRARNSYWVMPYMKSCRMTVTNEGNRFVTSFYYHVDYRTYPSLPADTAYFHAYYRQELPARQGVNYEMLNINGTGHFIGAVLNVVQAAEGWFGEGDELFYIDGQKKAAIEGTGTEDYFNDAWGLRVTDGDWTGTPVAEGEGIGARLTGYRWHVPDPIPFTNSIRAEIEHYGWTYNPDGTARSGFEERPDLFSSVAFWYQKGVNEGLAEPPYGYARLPLGNAEQIEIENSVADVAVEKGKASVQKEVFWSKDLLFFEASGPGSRIDIPVDVAEDGKYEVLAEIATSPDYGDYVATLDGKLTNSVTMTWAQSDVPPQGAEIIHNYSEETYVAADRRFGWFDLSKGRHWLRLTCVGKDARSTAYHLGIDNVVLQRIPSLKEQPAGERLPENPAGTGGTALVVYRGRPLSFYMSGLAKAPSSGRPEIIRALGEFGADGAAAVPALTAALSDPDADVRAAAAWSITQVGPDAAAVTALSRLLADTNPRVRCQAALAIAATGPKALPVLPALIRALGDPLNYVRGPAANAIGAIGPAAKAAVRPLADGLLVKGETVFVLRAMASALGDIGADAREALPALRQTLKLLRVSWAAEEAILKIEGKPVPSWH